MRLALIWNWVELVSWQACLMGPLKWDYQAHSDGHSSGSVARIPPPNFDNNGFVNALEVSNFLSLFYDEHMRTLGQTFLYMKRHQPPSGAVVAAPTRFDFSPRDWRVQHLGGQRVCVLFLSSGPLPDHPRAQYRVVTSQILKKKEKHSTYRKEPCGFGTNVRVRDLSGI